MRLDERKRWTEASSWFPSSHFLLSSAHLMLHKLWWFRRWNPQVLVPILSPEEKPDLWIKSISTSDDLARSRARFPSVTSCRLALIYRKIRSRVSNQTEFPLCLLWDITGSSELPISHSRMKFSASQMPAWGSWVTGPTQQPPRIHHLERDVLRVLDREQHDQQTACVHGGYK